MYVYMKKFALAMCAFLDVQTGGPSPAFHRSFKAVSGASAELQHSLTCQ
jgi:hypothetical protein